MKRSFPAALAIVLSLFLITSCKTVKNEGQTDWVTVDVTINSQTHYRQQATAYDGVVGTAMIVLLPETLDSINNREYFPTGYFGSALLDLSSHSVTLSIPLNTSLRLAEVMFTGDQSITEIVSSKPTAYITGISDSITFSSENKTVTVQIPLGTLPPTVASVSPMNAATGIPKKLPVSIVFSESMNPATMTTNTEDTTCSGSIQVSADNFKSCIQMSASPVASGDAKTFTVVPAGGYAPGTSYSLKVTHAARNTSQNALLTEYTSSFKTGDFYETGTGSLDTSFGTGGKLTHDVNNADTVHDFSISSDGKILALIAPGSQDPFVWKLNLDGSVDTSFGTNGSIQSNSGGTATGSSDFVINDSGDMFIAGQVGFYDLRVWSYTQAGTINTDFNGSGYLPVQTGYYGIGIAMYPDGKVLVTGNSDSHGMMLFKLNSDGTYDTSFGTAGTVVSNPGGYNTGRDILVDADGKILICGESGSYSKQEMALWRFNSDGTPDTTFSGDGFVTHDNAAGDPANSKADVGQALAFDESGNILVAGYSYNGTDLDMVVWKFQSNGVLDSSFGTNGVAVYNRGYNDTASDLAVDGNGKIIMVGYSYSAADIDLAVIRYNASGTLDTSFGTSGVIIEHNLAGGATVDSGKTVHLMSSGNILVGGTSHNGSNNDAVILSYK